MLLKIRLKVPILFCGFVITGKTAALSYFAVSSPRLVKCVGVKNKTGFNFSG